MKKNYIYILLIFLAAYLLPFSANAAEGSLLGGVTPDFNLLLDAKDALIKLNDEIMKLTREVSTASAQMMKFGDMLICNGRYGAAAEINFSVIGIDIITVDFIAFDIYFSGLILYVIGFFVMMTATFYLFDIAFNLTIGIVLLPLALALWPFGITRDKLKLVIDSILYYVGLFIFLPLGVLIAKTLVMTIVDDAFSGSGFSFKEAFDQDQSDLIKDNLGLTTLTFLKLLLCYIVSLKIIPLMAGEFCEHFFGGALVGNPMNQKMAEMSKAATKPIKKLGNYGLDVLKHNKGKKLENMGKNRNSFMGRVLERYGKRMSKTQRR